MISFNNCESVMFELTNLNDIKVRVIDKVRLLNTLELGDEVLSLFNDIKLLANLYYILSGTDLITSLFEEDLFSDRISIYLYENRFQGYDANENRKTILNNNINKINKTKFFLEPSKILDEFAKDYDLFRYPEPNIDFSSKELSNILNSYFNTVDSKYKQLYNQMIKEDRILFLNEVHFLFDAFTMCTNNYKDKNNYYIVIPLTNNPIDDISAIIHELTHVIQYKELKSLNKENKLHGYNDRFYKEVDSMYSEFCYLNFLEEYNIDKSIVKNLRINNLVSLANHVRFVNTNVEFDFHLPYAYGGTISSYFDSIEDKKKLNSALKKFDKHKILDSDIEIYESIGCSHKVLCKSLKEEIKKCKM